MVISHYHVVSPAVLRPSRFKSEFSRPRHGMSGVRRGMCELARHGTAGARHGICKLVRHGTAGARHGMCELARHDTAGSRQGMCELAFKVAFDIPLGKQTSAYFLPYTQLAAARFVVATFTAGQTDTAQYCPRIIYCATLHCYPYVDRLGAA